MFPSVATATHTADDADIALTMPDGPVRLFYPPLPSTYSSDGHKNGTKQSYPGLPSIVNKTSSLTTPSPIPVEPGYIMTTSIPPQSTFAVPPHWHEEYAEYFRVVQGYVLLRLGQRYTVVGPDDGDVEILPGVIHSFGRADATAVPGSGEGKLSRAADKAWADWEAKHARVHGGSGSNGQTRSGAWTGQDVVMHEWTLPADGHKEVFFRNVLSWAKDNVEPLVLGDTSAGAGAGAASSRQGAGETKSGGLAWLCGMLWLVLTLLVRVPRIVHSLAYLDTHLLLLDDRYGKEEGGGSKGVTEGKGTGGDWDHPSRLSRILTHGLYGLIRSVGRMLGWEAWYEAYTPERLRHVARKLR
ncbi:hypothetical protein Micbo1qcDRAFT_206618 [Microdochium bolleyi]|uniref:Uncharacterized protein n=1 Tax=Microdochium bolleyi TaxID=196109 RepID=A0A136IVX6_9PEZI|nr:hypothetical protein Micbo1qcDRAFT_206618 [Microdochium bolleyi]